MDIVLKKSDNVVSRKIEDEYILVPIRNNVGDLNYIYTLDEVGARIWELIDGKRNFNDIHDAVCAEYDVSPDQATKDIREFLKDLESVGAVRMA